MTIYLNFILFLVVSNCGCDRHPNQELIGISFWGLYISCCGTAHFQRVKIGIVAATCVLACGLENNKWHDAESCMLKFFPEPHFSNLENLCKYGPGYVLYLFLYSSATFWHRLLRKILPVSHCHLLTQTTLKNFACVPSIVAYSGLGQKFSWCHAPSH